MTDPAKKADALRLLREKQEMLRRQGTNRYPQRGDFTADEVARIKAYLGPWRRD